MKTSGTGARKDQTNPPANEVCPDTFGEYVQSLIEKIPDHSDRVVSLCMMINSKMIELRQHVDRFCELKRYQHLLKQELENDRRRS